ncbi:IS5 family transposase [Bifidobacterium aerophilum]|uniref:IS5 family transposase n=1 Tax=Bifidobacterium aerophilum TaxID=1798155 RepID=A0A6N9Z7H0_9BIFI|nr:IS5 family transposase [Bifidobacterium aerophilum]NEG90659.1 IS5 family transposase [Bifidobacterium aerophilum]
MCTPRYDITREQFDRISHLLPVQRGNVVVDNYTFVNALLWAMRTGSPWRDMPECFGKWITIYQRFNRWSRSGVIERLFAALQEERIVRMEVRVLALDSTSVKVHQHATGAPPKRGDQAIGTSRGGRNTKIHMVACDELSAVEVHLSSGAGHDAPQGRVAIAALGAFMGLPLLMDRAYEGDATRQAAGALGLEPVVPPKRNRTDPWEYDRDAYKERNIVERLFNRIKHYRRVATRYEKLRETYLSDVHLALIAIHLKRPLE